MSAHLLSGETILCLPSARIASADVAPIREANTLLENAKAIRESAVEAAQTAEREGYERGREQAMEEMRATLGQTLDALQSQFAAENARREATVAHAAMETVKQVIDAHPAVDIILGLARRALEQSDGGGGVAMIHVAPEWADELAARLGSDANTKVVGDPSLAGFACRVVSGEGRIIADLDRQLAQLRSRWGLVEGAPQ